MPCKQFITSVSKCVSQYNCCLIGNSLLKPVSPHLLLGDSYDQRWIGMTFMKMILGIHAKCSWDQHNIAIKTLIQNFIHTIYFKIKSLLLQCLDHSNMFVYSPKVILCMGTSLCHCYRTHHHKQHLAITFSTCYQLG